MNMKINTKQQMDVKKIVITPRLYDDWWLAIANVDGKKWTIVCWKYEFFPEKTHINFFTNNENNPNIILPIAHLTRKVYNNKIIYE